MLRFINFFFTFRSDIRRGDGGGGGGGRGGYRKTVTLTDHINQDNKMQTLVLKGCPFRANENEVKEFFEGYDLKGDMEDSIFLQQENGRKDGKGAVIFKSEQIAQEAKDALQKKEIGSHGRYVILCDN